MTPVLASTPILFLSGVVDLKEMTFVHLAPQFRKGHSQHEQFLIKRLHTLGLAVMALLWVPPPTFSTQLPALRRPSLKASRPGEGSSGSVQFGDSLSSEVSQKC